MSVEESEANVESTINVGEAVGLEDNGNEAELEASRLNITEDIASVTDFDTPTMGILSKVNGKHVIISGGKPKSDWSGLMNPQPHRSPFQLRELFKVSSKDYKYRCEPLSIKITKESNLVTVGEPFLLQFNKSVRCST